MKTTLPSPSAVTRRDAFRILGVAGAAALFAPRILRGAEPLSTSNTAPSLAGAQPGFHRFKIGAIEAIALHDGGFSTPPAQSPVGVGEPPAKIVSTLHDAFLAEDHVEIPFNALLLRTGGELVLIDTGCGQLYGPAGGQLVGHLADAGIRPEQISAVILTHLHGDHFGGLVNQATSEPVFKNARLFIHRKEYDFWSGPMPDLSAMPSNDETRKSFIAGAQSCLNALKGKWEFIRGGDRLVDGIEIIEAFGHTPGHIALQFSSGADRLLHFVDIAHNHALSLAHPDWKLGFDTQPDIAIATRRKLLMRASSERIRVFGGHMPFPSLGHVRPRGQGYEFVIEPFSIA